MDGIAAITARIGQIEAVIGSLSARTAPAPTTSSADFATVLATEASRTASAGTPASTATSSVGAWQVPGGPSLTAEQMGNAQAVVAAGAGMGLSLRDQAIGVMTAMGESSLRVVDHGDAAGPDSRGLFQQRDNGAWGTYADRMDPTRSAQSFFRALARVDGRDGMAPTLVAHTVQRNADPNHYARYWDDAVAITARITGASRAQITG